MRRSCGREGKEHHVQQLLQRRHLAQHQQRAIRQQQQATRRQQRRHHQSTSHQPIISHPLIQATTQRHFHCRQTYVKRPSHTHCVLPRDPPISPVPAPRAASPPNTPPKNRGSPTRSSPPPKPRRNAPPPAAARPAAPRPAADNRGDTPPRSPPRLSSGTRRETAGPLRWAQLPRGEDAASG